MTRSALTGGFESLSDEKLGHSLTVIRPAGPQDIAVSDLDNPRSVINLVSPVVREAMKRVPEEFLSLNDKELENLSPQKAFTVTDRRLRTAFWIEYGRAQDSMSSMNMAGIYGGICSRPYFYTNIMQDKVRLAYLLTPPQDYKVAMEEALSYGVDKIREILEMPLYDQNTGRPDPKIADVILKAVALIDQRVKGAVVQRHQVHQLNQNVGAPKAQAPGGEAQTMAEIDRKLAELEDKLGAVKKTIPDDIVIEAEISE